MKRAQAHEVGATAFELNVAAHHVNDVNAGQQLLQKAGWDHLRVTQAACNTGGTSAAQPGYATAAGAAAWAVAGACAGA